LNKPLTSPHDLLKSNNLFEISFLKLKDKFFKNKFQPTHSMRIFYFLFFITYCFSNTYAQNNGFEITPLSSNYVLKFAKERLAVRGIDSIDLPFVDDFSYEGPYPDSDFWLDNSVYVNSTMAFNPPSVGVASFDGLDSKGRPYITASTTIGSADTLTSNYINLKNFIAPDGNRRDLKTTDGVVLSFFLQNKGLTFASAFNDSIVLEFRDNGGTWNIARSYKGVPDSILKKNPIDTTLAFQYYAIPITEAKYFYGKFQFRFRNYARLGGAYEHWHLDYVKLAANRTTTRQYLDDLAFVEKPKPILKRYTSMPWKQAHPQLRTEIIDTFKTKLYNHFEQVRNPTNTKVRVTTSTGVTALPGITLIDAPNIPPSVFYSSFRINDTITVAQQLGTVSATTEKLTINTEYSLDLDAQEVKDLKKVALRNDKVTTKTVFDNYYAYDDGTAEMQFTATGENKQFAIQFKANVGDTLKGFQIFFPHINGDAPKDALLNIRIWKDSLTTKPLITLYDVKPIYTTQFYDTLQGFASYNLGNKYKSQVDTTIFITAGDFYIGWQNVGDVLIPIGLDRNNFSKVQYLYQSLNGKFVKLETPIKVGAVMIRPVFGQIIPTDTREIQAPLTDYMKIYPNPVQNQLFFELKKGQPDDYNVSVFNLQGQLMKREILRGSSMDVENLNNGIYVLKIQDLKNHLIFSHKIIIQK
jgi:Secretion system C-terminal sorting domain